MAAVLVHVGVDPSNNALSVARSSVVTDVSCGTMRRASKQEDGAARTIRERLHGRVPAHAIKATHALVGGVTGIDFGEFDVGASGGKSVARGVPSRLHVLAVAAPAATITW